MRMLIGVAVAACTLLAPGWALADATQDEGTAQAIARGLKESGRMHNYKVGVAVRDGTAWLSGSVVSQQQHDTAMQIAQGTPGVAHVISRIDIAQAAEAQLDRSRSLAGRLRQSLSGSQGSDIRLTSSLQGRQGGLIRQQSARRAVPPLARGAAPEPPNPVGQRHVSMGQAPQQYNHLPAGSRAPLPYARMANNTGRMAAAQPVPSHVPSTGGVVPARLDHPNMPNYAWPSYAAHPNYAGLTYPKQYSPAAWPYIGPFYPYPQVPLGWRKVTLEWDDGWWMLDFKD